MTMGKELLRRPKTIKSFGEWKVVTGKSVMPKTAFALSKNNGYVLGRNWHWRVDVLDTAGQELRLLTCFNDEQEEFKAWLAMPRPGGLAVIGRLEFHGDHPGWHAHVQCGEVNEIETGDQDYRMLRLPGGMMPHRQTSFDVSESKAMTRAFRFFCVSDRSEDSFI
jgi:hypothetical protein